ncbi:class I SAM-dependent methyltransferase [Sphingobium algorifonticola]|uniref:Methyltransferase domain-containing protein n=1 Tax=Sphingobium algorifonticola TaxID=2008318 RepID=A0A437JBW5_9SPHN|nr:class I SAM-dependent methyltransferase [Sphingobium algorifonticola]RVT43263.1 methyltransferase domain-containing protein [Sphingobium algorifonticola]
MDRAAYSSMSAQEADHWWFVARRAIISHLIERHVPLGDDARILEAGCGTGGNLSLLAGYGRLDAFEYDADARALAAGHGIGTIAGGALPHDIGFGDTDYDMIALLDVLEHIDDDRASLAALGGRLKTDGRLLLTVPAVPWLWSDHDALHHHKRRYTRESLQVVAQDAGMQVQAIGYFNSLLFPLAVMQRIAHQVTRSKAALDARPSAPVNAMLKGIFAAERHLVDHIRFPIGLSLYAVLSR